MLSELAAYLDEACYPKHSAHVAAAFVRDILVSCITQRAMRWLDGWLHTAVGSCVLEVS